MATALKRASSEQAVLPETSSLSRISSLPTRGPWVDRPDIPPTRREGWLLKKHRGQEVGKGKLRRWFVSDGFHVEYYEGDGLHKRMGRFDLRNVVGLRPSTDPDVAPGIDLELSETIKGTVTKIVTVSFEGLDPSEVSGWSTLWASAVSVDYVDDALRSQRNESLAHHLDQICWAQGAKMSSFRREMSSGGGRRRSSSGVLQSPRMPDFAPARRASYRRKQLTQAATAPPPDAASNADSPPTTPTPSSSFVSASSAVADESSHASSINESASSVEASHSSHASSINASSCTPSLAPMSRTSSLPVGVTGPHAPPPQPPRPRSASADGTTPVNSAGQPASAVQVHGRRVSSGASRRLSLNDVRRLHRQISCQTGGVARVGRRSEPAHAAPPGPLMPLWRGPA